MPQAACWAAGSRSAAAWQVTDIKEPVDPEVVRRKWSDTLFSGLFYEIFFVTLQATEPVWVCLVSVSVFWSCEAALLVGGGLIGKALHA